jgi:type IV secretion system protein VirB3
MAEEAGLVADPLFVGLTRPPMLFGVSYNFVLMNGFVCLMGYITTSNFKFFLMMFVLHGIGYYICSKEPLFIELFLVKSQKCKKRPNSLFHGANSYDQY